MAEKPAKMHFFLDFSLFTYKNCRFFRSFEKNQAYVKMTLTKKASQCFLIDNINRFLLKCAIFSLEREKNHRRDNLP